MAAVLRGRSEVRAMQQASRWVASPVGKLRFCSSGKIVTGRGNCMGFSMLQLVREETADLQLDPTVHDQL